MKTVKALLLGAAASFVAVAGAQAANLPVKARSVQYVKICSLYGAGFYYIPGTDTCLKVGGFVRIDAVIGPSAAPFESLDLTANTDDNATNNFGTRARAVATFDARSQTAYGTLRSYMTVGLNKDNAASGPQIYRAFIQLAGFTWGLTTSIFDAYSITPFHLNYVAETNGGIGATGTWQWAYTAQFGNGLSASIAAEDPYRRRAGIINASNGEYWDGAYHDATDFMMVPFQTWASVNSHCVDDASYDWIHDGDSDIDAAWCYDTGARSYGVQGNSDLYGTRYPDITANLRIDQSWGYAQVAGAIHDASTVDHDATGYAISVGGLIKVPGMPGDSFGFQGAYGHGATSFVGLASGGPSVNYTDGGVTSLGWMSDGVEMSDGIKLTDSWSVEAGYEHAWNSQWKTSLAGGYFQVNYDSAVKNMYLTGMYDNCWDCFYEFRMRNPDWSLWNIGSRTTFTPVKDLNIGLDVMYTHINSAFKNTPDWAQPLWAGGNSIGDNDIWTALVRVQRDFHP